MNIAATREDVMHVLRMVKPTHVATIEEKLDTVQAALASLEMTNTKVMTVRCKVHNLPQVCSLSWVCCWTFDFNHRIVPGRYHWQDNYTEHTSL